MRREELDDIACMRDMLEAACEVVEFTQGRTWDDYRDSKQLRRSVERSIEIIGEAARRVTRATQNRYPQIPWDRVIPTRHRLAHEYDSLDDSIVRSIATKHVPPLIQSLKAILPPDPVDPG